MYEIQFMQGNQISLVKCKSVIFPSTQDFFITCEENLETPFEEEMDKVHIPKHLILCVKEYDVIEKDGDKVTHLKAVRDVK